MNTSKRRQSLLDLLRKQPCFRVVEMADVLDVSQSTIRNDLNALEQEGKLKRVHGGAILSDQNPLANNSFKRRYQQNLHAKLIIAQHAAQLISDGDSILLDASSTAFCLASALSDRRQLRVVTNGFEVARELAKNTSNSVILIGGYVNYNASSVTGLLSEQIIEDLHMQKAFLSCSGFSLERGMTEVHIEEGQLKRKIIGSSQELFALIDSSKFGKEDLTPFARPENINRIFTDDGLSMTWRENLAQSGIEVTICTEEEDSRDE